MIKGHDSIKKRLAVFSDKVVNFYEPKIASICAHECRIVQKHIVDNIIIETCIICYDGYI